MTGNKSEGNTLLSVGADLRDDVFSHGQAYVIASRVPTAAQFGVLVSPDRIITRGDATVVTLMTNVMFPKLLPGGAGVAQPAPGPLPAAAPLPPDLPSDIQRDVDALLAWQLPAGGRAVADYGI